MKIKRFIKDKLFPAEANFYAKSLYFTQLLNNAIARGVLSASTRTINPSLPESWEFSGFSQNGEDGIIQFLLKGLVNSNKFFIEIGSGNGLENNTSYLGHISKFTGIQVEGDKSRHEDALTIKPWLMESLHLFVNEATVEQLFQRALFKDPEVFSLDIDGMDYYIMKLMLEKGLRPKIIVVEYNSAFGPERSVTLPYDPGFNMFSNAYPYLYYGVSLQGWKTLLGKYNYNFITVETNGVNAFFVQPASFKDGFLENITPILFKENIHQRRLFRTNHDGQFELIKELPFESVV